MDDRRILIAFGRVAATALCELAGRHEGESQKLIDLAGEFDALSQRLETTLLGKQPPIKSR